MINIRIRQFSPAIIALAYNSLSGSYSDFDEEIGVGYEQGQRLTNWSSTHHASPARIYEPKSAQECIRVLQMYHNKKMKIRPVGTALSPNGIGLSSSNADSLISLAHLDYVEVDVERKQVTVGAGARVSSVLSELNKFGLTLENFSSIQEQQMGGWTQVSAHGTGITLPPVDEMIVRLQLATPTEGLLTLSKGKGGNDDLLFRSAKVALGSLGVVTELTLKCIPKLNLEETISMSSRDDVMLGHAERLRKFRHVRYMWIPYTSDVVVVVSNPTSRGPTAFSPTSPVQPTGSTNSSIPTEAMVSLIRRLRPSLDQSLSQQSFSQLRDQLLDIAPLDQTHIKAVNLAEADFWTRSCGQRVADSVQILGFDCGGQQLVLEVCIPMTGSRGSEPSNSQNDAARPENGDCLAAGHDIRFVRDLLEAAENAGMPAPSPIEQRWTARSSSPLSPAYSADPQAKFSWVGIIMYLPSSQSKADRIKITDKFRTYSKLIQPLCDAYGAKTHWAKIELPTDSRELRAMQDRLHQQYPLDQINALRNALDPHRVLSNKLIDSLLEHPVLTKQQRHSWENYRRP